MRRQVELISTIVFIFIQPVHAQNFPVLHQEEVRCNILASSEEEFPDGPTELADRPIKLFPLANYTLAHVQYKSGGGEAFMKQSYVLVPSS